MNTTLIKNWNNVVTKDDSVYVLGDMFFCNLDEQRRFMKALNGHKILIMGNHDKYNGTRKTEMTLSDYIYVGWEKMIPDFMITDKFGLTHDPATCNIDMSMNWLCGHIHNIKLADKNIYNVGVDVNNFTPISEEEVLCKLNG
jgi:calcineurin-like phosphoesterase family protein